MGVYIPCKHKQKKAVLAIEIAGKVEFRKINIIKIKSTTLQENLILNGHAFNKRTSKYMNHKFIVLKGQIDKPNYHQRL